MLYSLIMWEAEAYIWEAQWNLECYEKQWLFITRGTQEVNINNLYQTGPKETKETDTITLENKTVAEKHKNIKEVKTDRKDHVSSGLGKGNVNIIFEKGTEDDLVLTKT